MIKDLEDRILHRKQRELRNRQIYYEKWPDRIRATFIKRMYGLLCLNCNRGIGGLKDDPSLCKLAADYLEKGEAL